MDASSGASKLTWCVHAHLSRKLFRETCAAAVMIMLARALLATGAAGDGDLVRFESRSFCDNIAL